MESNQPLDSNFKEGLHLSGQSLGYLKETAKWGKFLAIVGFVMLGLVMLIFLLLAIFVGSTGLAALDGPESAVFGAMGAATIMFYVFLFIIFYFIPSLFLYRFATNMQIALRNEVLWDINSHFSRTLCIDIRIFYLFWWFGSRFWIVLQCFTEIQFRCLKSIDEQGSPGLPGIASNP